MEKKLPISKNKKFIYSITYQHSDEESSELGEFKEIGFEVEKSTDTIGKILKLANENYNIYYPISVGNWESTSPVEDRDYWEKGIHKFYVLHINNEDGTSISEEENNFITYLLSNGQYNSDEFEEFYLGGLIIGGLIGGYIGYYYGKNPRKKYDFGGEVVGNQVTYNYYGEEQKGDILEVLDDTALVVQTGTNKRLVDGSDVIKIHYNSYDAGGKIQEEITYLENRIYNLEQLRDVAGEEEIEYYNKIIKDLEKEKSQLISGEVEEEPKKKKFFFFADGGKIDEFDFDEKMALINLDMCYEYSVKLDKMVSEDTKLEDWVKMKLTIVEQNIADVKHALEGWEKFGEGGMIFKKQLLHIAKYSKELIEMIQKGSRLMSWQENKLAVSSAMIDAIYHHLDYEFGNRASKLNKEKYADGGGVSDEINDLIYEVMYPLDVTSQTWGALKMAYYDAETIEEKLEYIEDARFYTNIDDPLYYKLLDLERNIERIQSEETDEDEYAKGGGVSTFKEGDKVTNRKGKNRGVGFIVTIHGNVSALVDFVEEGKSEWVSLSDLKKVNKYANGGGVDNFPPKGELKNKDNFLLKYEKRGIDYEFYIYKPEKKDVSSYEQIKYVCVNKDCPTRMSYNQFINYLYAESYLDDRQYAKGGGVGDKIDLLKDELEKLGIYVEKSIDIEKIPYLRIFPTNDPYLIDNFFFINKQGKYEMGNHYHKGESEKAYVFDNRKQIVDFVKSEKFETIKKRELKEQKIKAEKEEWLSPLQRLKKNRYADGGGVGDVYSKFDLNEKGNFSAVIDNKNYEIIYRDDTSKLYDLFENNKKIKSSKVLRDLMQFPKYAKGGGVGEIKHYYNGMSKEEILSKTIVYDNQGETLDRYTIFTPDGSVFGMSETASGFNQYIGDETEIEKGKHLGKKLTSVPKDIQWAVLDRMIEEYADGGFMEEVVTKPKVAPTPVTTPKPNTDNPYKPKTKTPPKAKYDFLLLNK